MSEVTLKELVHSRLDAIEASFVSRMDSMQKAADKAEAVLQIRLESMNEFRAAMKDQASNLATKGHVERLEERIRSLENHRSYTLGIAAILAVVVSVLLKFFG